MLQQQTKKYKRSKSKQSSKGKYSSLSIHQVYDFIDEIWSEDNDNEIKLRRIKKYNIE